MQSLKTIKFSLAATVSMRKLSPTSLLLTTLLLIPTSGAWANALNTELVWNEVHAARKGLSSQEPTSKFVVDFGSFSRSVRNQILKVRKDGDDRAAKDKAAGLRFYEYHPEQCQVLRSYSQSLLEKILQANALKNHVKVGDLPLRFLVPCSRSPHSDLPDANMAAGTIAVQPGMIKTMQSEEVLASVIAHELAHFLLRHDAQVAQRRNTWSAWFKSFLPATGDIFQGSSSDEDVEQMRAYVTEKEIEADALGALLMVRAGYQPEAAIESLRLADERRTRHEREFEREVSIPRQQMIAKRIEILASQLAKTDGQARPFLAYPTTIQEAVEFYFDLSNLKN